MVDLVYGAMPGDISDGKSSTVKWYCIAVEYKLC